ncbi:hypothetical protein EV193_103142 [Herbihabitans rhizosphaerae]|uniref:Excreted virulence factor EspC (Type VII ESX diderm) n=1 Tax=Herbihabitans rhizosphaerae TaxID=1872711 RepID=A0A4Q7KUZ8_9PSEU|nr:hypothetical protein [Herbihabitans rhizosphaerae]RZS40828.1 hypothetical protein EV193_103142 [Herbihabitans rhizosphaerae]
MGNIDRALNPSRYDANGKPGDPAPAGGTRPSGAGGGEPANGYNVDPAALTRASKAAAGMMDRLGKDGRIPDDTSQSAAGLLSGENFQLGGALKGTAETWYSQITTLHQACHKIEQSLAANAKGYRMVEDRNEMSMAQISQHFE